MDSKNPVRKLDIVKRKGHVRKRLPLLAEIEAILLAAKMVISPGCQMERERGYRNCFRCPFFTKEVRNTCPDRKLVYERIDYIKTSWNSLITKAGVEDLQIYDLRTFFNWVLRSKYNFTSKEAGDYIGNTDEVNDAHYSPVSMDLVRERIGTMSMSEAIGLSPILLN